MLHPPVKYGISIPNIVHTLYILTYVHTCMDLNIVHVSLHLYIRVRTYQLVACNPAPIYILVKVNILCHTTYLFTLCLVEVNSLLVRIARIQRQEQERSYVRPYLVCMTSYLITYYYYLLFNEVTPADNRADLTK